LSPLCGAEIWSRGKMMQKYLGNVMLEKDGEDGWTDRVKNEEV
jgi:hypothetical protein